ncbi:MAG: hypothetical protein ACPGJE_04835 [Wenzhouxiangellaceae bacterium]
MSEIDTDPRWRDQEQARTAERPNDSDEVRAYRAVLKRLKSGASAEPEALKAAARALPGKARSSARRERLVLGVLVAAAVVTGLVASLPLLIRAADVINALGLPWLLLIAAAGSVVAGRALAGRRSEGLRRARRDRRANLE